MSLDDKMKAAAQEHGKSGGSDFFQFKTSGVYRVRVLSEPEAMATHFFGKGTPGSVCYGEGKGCPFHGDIPNVAEDAKEKEYKDPSVKFMCYVLDRSDNKIKIGELPWSVLQYLSKYEKDDELGFDCYPMPYDVKITVDKENKDPKQIYSVLPGQARTELTVEQRVDLEAKMGKQPIPSYIEKRKEKQADDHKSKGIWVDDATREAKHADRMKRAKEIAEENGGSTSSGIEYPKDDINPDDIPF